MRCVVSRLWVALLLLLLGAAPPADPPRLDLTLDPSLPIQSLPAEVSDLTRGPDGRIWYVIDPSLEGGGKYLTLQEHRAQIAREFSRPAPQLLHVYPVAFEPRRTPTAGDATAPSRVWFCALSSEPAGPAGPAVFAHHLFAYDGTSFIDAPADAMKDTFADRAIPVPNDVSPPMAFCAGGSVFFTGRRTMLSFDGKDWHTQTFEGPPPTVAVPGLRAYPVPDGQSVVVLTNNRELWRWRAGKWIRLVIPGQDTATLREDPGTLHVRSDGIWVHSRVFLQFIPLDPPSPEFAALLTQLNADDFPARDAATAKLTALGTAAYLDIQRAYALELSAEQRARLESICRPWSLTTFGFATLKLGDFTLSTMKGPTGVGRDYGVDFIYGCPDGATLIGSGDGNKQYVLRVAPAPHPETVTKIADQGAYAALGRARRTFPESNRSAWFGDPGSAARLVDLTSGQVLKTLPNPLLEWPRLASADQSVWYFRHYKAWYAYRPGAPSTAIPLPQPQLRVVLGGGLADRSGCFKTGDGALWLYARQTPASTERIQASPRGMVPRETPPYSISLFDGAALKPVPHAAALPEYRQFIAGYDAVLCQSGESFGLDARWQLLTRDTLSDPLPLQDLVATRAADIRKSFAGPESVRRIRTSATALHVDAIGNIWLRAGGGAAGFRVFAKDRWLDAHAAVQEVLGPIELNSAASFMPLGDNKHLYLSFSNRSAVRAVLLSCDGDKIHAQRAPASDTPYIPTWNLRAPLPIDPQGALWLNTAEGAVRLTAQGAEKPIPNAIPLTVDAGGNIWLAFHSPEGRDSLQIYRKGELHPIPPIPALIPQTSVIPAGDSRVLIWTAAGLHELTAAPPAAASPFVVRRVFAVNEWIRPESFDFSALLQTLTWTNNSVSNPLLFYRLPPENP